MTAITIAAAFVVAVIVLCYWYRVREHPVTQGSVYSALHMMGRGGHGEYRLLLRLRPGEKVFCVKKDCQHQQEHRIELLIPQTGWSEPYMDRLLGICASRHLSFGFESEECGEVSECLLVDLGDDLLFASDVITNLLVEGLDVSSADKVVYESVAVQPSYRILK